MESTTNDEVGRISDAPSMVIKQDEIQLVCTELLLN